MTFSSLSNTTSGSSLDDSCTNSSRFVSSSSGKAFATPSANINAGSSSWKLVRFATSSGFLLGHSVA
ncbi:hypothetical protein Scep_006887 [Stephania cephalantha]|uniref:Uncharacterized protein n=1 Tax=Stephania cephalantha TaxID=152367 RepID=A0AAP0KA12_9MAGN